ncbi:MAG: hypothetical protein COB09_18600 [Thalassobium sp.]|nr:MAG: hypothetical protein COB09_18600 [Thalassobium sp.]
MPTHILATRNLVTDAVVDQLDNGDLQFQTSGDAEVATCDFAATAFGASVAGVATANAITSDASAVGGVVDHAVFRNSGGTEIVLGITVGTSATEIIISSLTIAPTDQVAVTSLTYECMD